MRAARVQRAAAHRLPDRTLDQFGLAGQRRLVQHRRTRLDQPIHRQHLTRADDHEIPDGDLIHRHLGDQVADPPARGARRPFQQRPQIPGGAPLRGGVQRPAGRQHHRDQRTRQVLAHRQRAQQGQDRDQVDTERPPQQRRHHPAHRRDDRGDRRRSPQGVGPPARPGHPRHPARHQQGHRRDEQRRLEPPPHARQHSPPGPRGRPDEASPLDTGLSSVAIGPAPTVHHNHPHHRPDSARAGYLASPADGPAHRGPRSGGRRRRTARAGHDCPRMTGPGPHPHRIDFLRRTVPVDQQLVLLALKPASSAPPKTVAYGESVKTVQRRPGHATAAADPGHLLAPPARLRRPDVRRRGRRVGPVPPACPDKGSA